MQENTKFKISFAIGMIILLSFIYTVYGNDILIETGIIDNKIIEKTEEGIYWKGEESKIDFNNDNVRKMKDVRNGNLKMLYEIIK